MVEQGSLEKLAIADIFQLIDQQSMTGELVVRDWQGVLHAFVRDGFIVQTHADPRPKRMLLGQILSAQEVITEEALQRALDAQQAGTKKPLGQVLLEQEAVDLEALSRAIQLQTNETVQRMFLKTRGTFEWTSRAIEASPFDLSEPVRANTAMVHGLMAKEDWAQVSLRMPSLRTQLKLAVPLGESGAFSEAEDRVRGLVSSDRTLEKIIGLSGLTDLDACLAITSLLGRGWLAIAVESPDERDPVFELTGLALDQDEGQHEKGVAVDPTMPIPNEALDNAKPPAEEPGSDEEQKIETQGDVSESMKIGQVVAGRYRLDKMIARGGMGRVYKATQAPLGRHVAIKILDPSFVSVDPKFSQRFLLEASTCARLSHPNIITLFDYGEAEDGQLFMAMEYLVGRTLSREITKSGPFSFSRTVHVAIQIARALREAHAKKVVHRDLKPGNIMMIESEEDRDFVKVLDFGLAKAVQSEGHDDPSSSEMEEEGAHTELTRAGMLLGSPRYMAPEQIRREPLDGRCDVYALGAIIFQMLTGKPPFSGKTNIDIFYKHMNEPPPDMWRLNPSLECPEAMVGLIHRCLAKDRNDRFESMDEVVKALKACKIAPEQGEVSDTSASSPIYLAEAALQNRRSLDSSVGGHSSITNLQEVDVSEELSAEFHAQRVAVLQDAALVETAQSRWPLAAGLMVLGVGIGAVAFALLLNGPSDAPQGVGPGSKLGMINQAEAPVREEVKFLPEAPPKPEVVKPTHTTAEFLSEPSGAMVTLNDKALGITPFQIDLPLPEAGKKAAFVFVKDGYKSVTLEVSVSAEAMKLHTQLFAKEVPEVKVERRPTRSKRASESSLSRADRKAEDQNSPLRRNPYR